MKVQLTALRETADVLFRYLESQGKVEFDIEDDYYWTIATNQLYEPRDNPTDLGLEQLADNWEWLDRVRRRTTDPIPYHPVWFAAILRWIGQKTAP